MALCRDCRNPIPCHCHVTPATEIRPGVYAVTNPYPAQPDSPTTHGMTMGGEPAMPILVAEYNALIARVAEAEARAAVPAPADRAAILHEAAFAVGADTQDIRYGSATDYANRHANLLHRMAAAVPSAPADRADLRDRIAAALYERERPPRDPHWADAFAADREVFEAMADAVLAALPASADRAALLALAEKLIEHCPEHGCVEPEWEDGCHCEIVPLLRRMADEAVRECETPHYTDGPCHCPVHDPNAHRTADEAQPAHCGAREPEPRTGTGPCVLPGGHDGPSHQDRHTNRWPAAEARQPETLPPPEGPEYTRCACDHIEPAHGLNAGACWTCDCLRYRPEPAAAAQPGKEA